MLRIVSANQKVFNDIRLLSDHRRLYYVTIYLILYVCAIIWGSVMESEIILD
jgi:hypothetical protein